MGRRLRFFSGTVEMLSPPDVLPGACDVRMRGFAGEGGGIRGLTASTSLTLLALHSQHGYKTLGIRLGTVLELDEV